MRNLDPNVPDLDAPALERALDEGKTLLVVYYADWCGFSRAFVPTFEDRADELPIPAIAVNISSPKNPLWKDHKVTHVPTIVLYEDGEETHRVDGRSGRGLKREDLDRLTQHISA